MPLDIAGGYGDLIKKHGFVPANHEKPNFFDVTLQPIFDSKGKIIPGYQRVQNEANGASLAVHSENYRIIPYRETFEKFDNAIIQSGLDTTDMLVATDMTHDGARCFRQYLFPSVTISVGGKDLALRIISFNSYDGSYAMSFMAGFYVFVCANMSVLGTDLIKLKMKHVGDVETKFEDGATRVALAGSLFVSSRDRLQKWAEIKVGPHTFAHLIDTCMPQSTERLCNELVAGYATSQEPKTLWSAYNVLTAWSTHTETTRKGYPQARALRERRVAACIEGAEWKALEAA